MCRGAGCRGPCEEVFHFELSHKLSVTREVTTRGIRTGDGYAEREGKEESREGKPRRMEDYLPCSKVFPSGMSVSPSIV
jgi:hypothetical protein